jgi:hypothetical protein
MRPEGRAGAAALLAALAVGLSAGCIDDPVEYGTYNVLIAELSLAWNTVDRHYVGFGQAGADWDQSWETAKAKMDTVVSTRGLGRVLEQMLGELDDPGVSAGGYRSGASGRGGRLSTAPNVDSTVLAAYLDSLGFQQIQAGWGYCMVADSTVPLFVITGWSGFSWGIFDQHFDSLKTAPGMVIDIRMAPSSEYSFLASMPKLIANRFADEVRAGYFRQYRTGSDREELCEPLPCIIHPRGGFTGPTLILAGPQNARLSERFVSMMGSLPHVTLAGDTTAGNADPASIYLLETGHIAFPDTAILAWDSLRIHRNGLAADVVVPAGPEDFAQGVDPVLEYALDWAESPSTTGR